MKEKAEQKTEDLKRDEDLRAKEENSSNGNADSDTSAQSEISAEEQTQAQVQAGQSYITVLYIGSNPSYTVAGVRFSKKNSTARVDAETAKSLIKTGKFAEVPEDLEGFEDGR